MKYRGVAMLRRTQGWKSYPAQACISRLESRHQRGTCHSAPGTATTRNRLTYNPSTLSPFRVATDCQIKICLLVGIFSKQRHGLYFFHCRLTRWSEKIKKTKRDPLPFSDVIKDYYPDVGWSSNL